MIAETGDVNLHEEGNGNGEGSGINFTQISKGGGETNFSSGSFDIRGNSIEV